MTGLQQIEMLRKEQAREPRKYGFVRHFKGKAQRGKCAENSKGKEGEKNAQCSKKLKLQVPP